MELWDIYDINRNKTGQKHVRGRPMRKGEYHLSVFVWTFNRAGQLLLTRRSPEKESYPNQWAVTGGAAVAGESSLQAIQRELREETGIHAEPEEFRQVGSYRRKNGFCDVYFLQKDIPLEQLTLQPGETCDARWVSRAEFEALRAAGVVAKPDVNRYSLLQEQFGTLFR